VLGVGLLGAIALAATVTDPGQFRSGRQFAAWLGLTPLNNSSGGKERLGRIPSGPAVRDRANRPDTRLHPTTTPKPHITPCNAGAIHTGRSELRL
jgi:transposase